ncbi:MAG: IclR family transcriptional regulator [Streptosporangiales bacterium]|nr:IclR family transcriptional regulator [Streptosporangiales bacterium]
MPTARDDGVRSVDRALTVLQTIAKNGDLPMTEIAAAVGVHKSTAFRLLGTLEARGMVERTADRGTYRLGQGVMQLAAAANGRRYDLTSVARPVCERLAEQVGETVNLAVPDGDAVVSVDQVIGTAAVTTVNWVGQRTPMHATAAGKLFLAEQDRAARRRRPYRRYTEHTVVDPAELRSHLSKVREQGYATTLEEHEVGLVGVAAPVRSFDGAVVAALVVSGPAYRLTADAVPRVAAEVVAAADEITQRGGAPRPA